jgi:hypothetical protein
MEDNEYEKWINSFHNFVKPDDGKLYVIRDSDNLEQVYRDLEKMGV